VNELPELSRRLLAVLATSSQPISGRRVASLTGMSATTCNKTLAALSDLGVARWTRKGQARMWSATAAARDVLGSTVERDALILTALPLEYAAVRDRLEATGERRASSGARYCEATVIGQHIKWTIRIFETAMGNATAAAALARAAGDFLPDVVVFCGVAGGLRGSDQKHGDVVVVERAYLGHGGKSYVDEAGESAFKSRPKALLAPVSLVENARSIRREPEPLRAEFAITVADLVSTEEVLADPNSSLSQRIKKELDNCVAVDMESHGVYEAARQLNLLAIAVRGLSDLNGKKDPANDRNWQPVAASNAAAVALELLIRAHPDDLPAPRNGGPVEPGPRPEGRPRPRPIPPQAERWVGALAAESTSRANAARRDLSNSTSAPKTTVSILTTHPPAWLREDRSGVAWAAVACVADAVNSRAARTAWHHAAAVAAASGDHPSAALFRISEVRSATRGVDGKPGDADVDETRDALDELDLSQADLVRPIVSFWQRAMRTNDPRLDEELLNMAGRALTALGRADFISRLSLDAAEPDAARATTVSLPAELRDYAIANILLTVAVYLLIHQDGRARLWADQALAHVPWSSEAQLRHEQVELQALHDSLRMGSADSVTEALIGIEAKALRIRDERRAWGGATDEALALAGRARVEMDDPGGALRLLTTAPRGTATAEEAASPAVVQMATVAALHLHDVELTTQLADQVEPPIERHFLRAATFSQSKNTHDWAREEYRAALELAEDASELRRAMLGLARLRVPVTTDDAMRNRLARLAELDAEGADLVTASAALVAGDAQTCLRYVRRYRSLSAVQLHADALSTLGRSADAIDVLDEYGLRTGDLTVRMQALELAGRASLWERATPLADAIIRAAGHPPLRRAARQVRADIAARAGDWPEVEIQMRRLISEDGPEPDPSLGDDPETHRVTSTYAWPVAEAMYHQRKFAAALDLLRPELRRSATDPQKVRLLLALLHHLLGEQPELIDDPVVDWVLAVGSSLINHEDIGASATALMMQLPRHLSQGQVVRARDMLASYFDTHGNSGAIRQLDLSPVTGDPDDEPDLTPLIEELKTSLQPSAEMRSTIATMVLAGRVPVGFLALATHRSYAEILISRLLGFTVARQAAAPSADSWLDPRRVAAAGAALERGTVLVDTSALVLSDRIGDRRALIAAFDKVLLPRSLQDDIYRARSTFAFRSSATMGWNQAAGKPILTEFEPETVERWARAAVELDETLPLLVPVDDAHVREGDPSVPNPDAGGSSRHLPLTAEATARQLGCALWVDDVGLLQLADAENVPAFGTPELIAAVRRTSTTPVPSDLEVLDLLRQERVVDLPLADRWWAQARGEQWRAESYTRLAISRPDAWRDVTGSFAEYQSLIRRLWSDAETWSQDERTMAVVQWCEAACVGLGRCLAPSVRGPVVGALIAWTALNTEPMLDVATIAAAAATAAAGTSGSVPGNAAMLEALLALSRRIQAELFPEGDGVRLVVVTLLDTVRSVSDGPTATAVLARACSPLTDAVRTEAMSALLGAPAARSSLA